ncbi:MAG: helix-turn-helix domain-containing protein [Pseudonocardiaceae bacterium]
MTKPDVVEGSLWLDAACQGPVTAAGDGYPGCGCVTLPVTAFRVMSVIGEMGDLAAQAARLEVLRSGLGTQLGRYRAAAGISQPQLGAALGRTRSLISKVEHGVRRMPEELWTIADELCGTQGVLVAAHTELMQAEADYRKRRRAVRRPLPPTPAQRDAPHRVWSAPAGWAPAGHQPDRDVTWSQTTLVAGGWLRSC